jgi:hypothetical protein
LPQTNADSLKRLQLAEVRCSHAALDEAFLSATELSRQTMVGGSNDGRFRCWPKRRICFPPFGPQYTLRLIAPDRGTWKASRRNAEKLFFDDYSAF